MASEPSRTVPTDDQTTSVSDRTRELLDEIEEGLADRKLPLEIYNNEDLYELELQRVFGRAWVFVGHESEIPEPGDYSLRYIGEDPFIFVRGEDGEVRLLFDSCTHRGTKLCRTQRGNTSHFRCPYHGWTFKNTGELIGVAQKHKAYPEIDKDELALHEPPNVDSYGGFVFASLDPDAPSLEEYLGDAAWYLDPHMKMIDWEVVGEPQRWTVNIDWKTVAENGSADSYHIPIGHKSAAETGIGSQSDGGLAGEDLSLMGGECGRLTYGIHRAVSGDTDIFWQYPDEIVAGFDTDAMTDEQIETIVRPAVSSIHNLFPNLSLNHTSSTNVPDQSPTGVCKIRQWQPRGPGQIEIWFWALVPANASEEYKETAYKAAMGTNGVAGNFFVDDLSILEGISETGGSMFAQKRGVRTDHTMGAGGRSDAERIADWPGPGRAYENAAYTDANNLNFYENWFEFLS